MNFFSAIFSNLLGYDLIIIVLGIFHLTFLLYVLRQTIEKLENYLKPIKYKSIDMLEDYFKIPKNSNNFKLDEIEKLKERQSFLFNAYSTIGSIFPLLGILGTILALISLKDFSSQIVTSSFSLALTSTFWGLVFAIVSRLFEGVVGPKVENNERQINILFNLEVYKKGQKHEKE